MVRMGPQGGCSCTARAQRCRSRRLRSREGPRSKVVKVQWEGGMRWRMKGRQEQVTKLHRAHHRTQRGKQQLGESRTGICLPCARGEQLWGRGLSSYRVADPGMLGKGMDRRAPKDKMGKETSTQVLLDSVSQQEWQDLESTFVWGP